MKKGTILFNLLVLCFISFSQYSFTINGEAPSSLNNRAIYLQIKSSQFETNEMETTIKKNKFTFHGSFANPFQLVALSINLSGTNTATTDDFFLKEGNNTVKLSTIVAQNKLRLEGENGLPFYSLKNQYDSTLRNFSQLINYQSSLNRTKATRDSFAILIKNLRTDEIVYIVDFFKRSSNTYFGLHILNTDIVNYASARIRISADSLWLLYSTLDSNLKETSLGRSIKEKIISRQKLSLFKQAPDFTFITSDMDTLSLQSFLHKKNVLLCFCASWCAPCKKDIPILKQIATLSKELQIVSISIDTSETKWKSMLEENSMPWIHTCTIPKYSLDKIDELYQVALFPTYYLIDKKGVIIYNDYQDEKKLKLIDLIKNIL